MCRATEACVGPGDGAYFDHRSRDNACVPAVMEAQEPPRYGRACPATVSHDGLNPRRCGAAADSTTRYHLGRLFLCSQECLAAIVKGFGSVEAFEEWALSPASLVGSAVSGEEY